MCIETCPRMKDLRHGKERTLFFLLSGLSVITFVFLFGMSFVKQEIVDTITEDAISEHRLEFPEAESLTDDEVLEKLDADSKDLIAWFDELSTTYVIALPLGLIVIGFLAFGKEFGRVRSDGIRVGSDQFPELFEHWGDLSDRLGLEQTPELYVINGNGALNAYATCVPGYRRYGVVYSDIIEKALESGEMETLRFVLGHELGHIKLGHVYLWYYLLTMLGSLPGLNYVIGLPLSRAREYSCDKIGHRLADDPECRALVMLAAGKHHFDRVNLAAYERDHCSERSVWETVYNFVSGHPNINWRIQALRNRCDGGLIFRQRTRDGSMRSGEGG